jgi:hypothetical protein
VSLIVLSAPPNNYFSVFPEGLMLDGGSCSFPRARIGIESTLLNVFAKWAWCRRRLCPVGRWARWAHPFGEEKQLQSVVVPFPVMLVSGVLSYLHQGRE